MRTVPCNDPERCGVQSHQEGSASAQACGAGSGGGWSADTPTNPYEAADRTIERNAAIVAWVERTVPVVITTLQSAARRAGEWIRTAIHEWRKSSVPATEPKEHSPSEINAQVQVIKHRVMREYPQMSQVERLTLAYNEINRWAHAEDRKYERWAKYHAPAGAPRRVSIASRINPSGPPKSHMG